VAVGQCVRVCGLWCRWVKYEQTVETGGRWSKPHVSTTSMRGLNALRRAIEDGDCSVGLDVACTSGQYDVAGERQNADVDVGWVRPFVGLGWIALSFG